jgi:hypothetical protein
VEKINDIIYTGPQPDIGGEMDGISSTLGAKNLESC